MNDAIVVPPNARLEGQDQSTIEDRPGPWVLGIETSCDDTAISLVHASSDAPRILVNWRSSQTIHAKHGGIVPWLAAREHVINLPDMWRTLRDAYPIACNDLCAVAVTLGPGLAPALMAGVQFAKGICMSLNVPLWPVHHLRAHILSSRMGAHEVSFPFLALIVSGGHTQLFRVTSACDAQLWAASRDDAVGEVLDKCARLMGLGFPGGPQVEQAATLAQGLIAPNILPRPMRGQGFHQGMLAMSFAGLKTSFARHWPIWLDAMGPVIARQEASYALQAAISDCLCDCVDHALRRNSMLTDTPEHMHIALVGGVASNKFIGKALQNTAQTHGALLVAPDASLCVDNAAMVAWCAIECASSETQDTLSLVPRARWPLDPYVGDPRRGKAQIKLAKPSIALLD